MQPANIRQKLHQYVDKGDDKLLKLMYAVAKEYMEEDDFEYEFSDEEVKFLEDRRAKRLNGESKMYNWQVAKETITGRRIKTLIEIHCKLIKRGYELHRIY